MVERPQNYTTALILDSVNSFSRKKMSTKNNKSFFSFDCILWNLDPLSVTARTVNTCVCTKRSLFQMGIPQRMFNWCHMKESFGVSFGKVSAWKTDLKGWWNFSFAAFNWAASRPLDDPSWDYQIQVAHRKAGSEWLDIWVHFLDFLKFLFASEIEVRICQKQILYTKRLLTFFLLLLLALFFLCCSFDVSMKLSSHNLA